MPTLPDPVDPGDLITAEDFNDLISRLEDLQERVENLENQQGGVVINGFDPPDEVEVGQPLAIVGTNFEFPPNKNTVEIDDRTIKDFLVGSTNTTLRLRVPDDIDVPEGGRNVTVRVENDAGSAQRVYRLLLASPDQPSIRSVTGAEGTSNLIVGETAVIKGENLGSSRENVIIEFIHATSDKVYPSDQNDLEVEEVSPTKIEVKVPEIDDTLPEDVSVRVTVDGLTAEQDAFVLELE